MYMMSNMSANMNRWINTMVALALSFVGLNL